MTHSARLFFLKEQISSGESEETLTHKCHTATKNENIMVIDDFKVFHWMEINASLLNELHFYNDAKIFVQVFDFPKLESQEYFAQWGILDFLIVHPKIRSIRKIVYHTFQIATKSKSGKDVLDYRIDGCQIGIDIYESILRRGYPQWEVNSLVQIRTVLQGVVQYYFVNDLIARNSVKLVAVSHDNYIGPGILARVSYINNVVVMLANPLDVTFTTRSFQNYEKFRNYRNYASSLSPGEYSAGITLGKYELEARLMGKIDNNMTYQTKSAFANSIERQLGENINTKILVATQDFFDSPHGYGPMNYCDFLDWMNVVADYADNSPTNIEWYLKCHPDASLDQHEIIRDFSLRHSRFKVVNPNTPWQQLRDEGLCAVITCYGSVAHELPLLNIPVLSCSYNPHVAYNFSYHSNSNKELFTFLSRIPNLENEEAVFDSKKFEIFEFYFVHNYITQLDSLFLNSYRKFSKIYNADWNSLEARQEILIQDPKIKRTASEIVFALKSKKYVRYFETKLQDYPYEVLSDVQVNSIFMP